MLALHFDPVAAEKSFSLLLSVSRDPFSYVVFWVFVQWKMQCGSEVEAFSAGSGSADGTLSRSRLRPLPVCVSLSRFMCFGFCLLANAGVCIRARARARGRMHAIHARRDAAGVSDFVWCG